MSDIRGTYNLANQLQSNREFGHFLVVSQFQVPREFGINLASVGVAAHDVLLSSFLPPNKRLWN